MSDVIKTNEVMATELVTKLFNLHKAYDEALTELGTSNPDHIEKLIEYLNAANDSLTFPGAETVLVHLQGLTGDLTYEKARYNMFTRAFTEYVAMVHGTDQTLATSFENGLSASADKTPTEISEMLKNYNTANKGVLLMALSQAGMSNEEIAAFLSTNSFLLSMEGKSKEEIERALQEQIELNKGAEPLNRDLLSLQEILKKSVDGFTITGVGNDLAKYYLQNVFISPGALTSKELFSMYSQLSLDIATIGVTQGKAVADAQVDIIRELNRLQGLHSLQANLEWKQRVGLNVLKGIGYTLSVLEVLYTGWESHYVDGKDWGDSLQDAVTAAIIVGGGLAVGKGVAFLSATFGVPGLIGGTLLGVGYIVVAVIGRPVIDDYVELSTDELERLGW